MFDKIQPFQYVSIRLPSDTVKIEQIIPNNLISLGKYGCFHSNSIIGRPYHLTFEILDRSEQGDGRELRIVGASEIHAESLLEEAEPDIADDISTSTPAATQFDEYGLPSTTDKSNVNIIDNTNNQKLTYDEIEALKSNQLSNPRELIAKIMANHSQLDQKTAFSLAKYTLRKQKKYMKRFTVSPLDVTALTNFMMEEKDFSKTMEIRNETLGLMGSWANVHASGPVSDSEDPRCRYLIVDDTGGLVVAALAERMGLLHHNTIQPQPQHEHTATNPELEDTTIPTNEANAHRRKPRHDHPLSKSNTLTLIHANQQPNLSLLRYFAFDPTQPASPHDPTPHPLHTHLQTLTWLQLLHPDRDSTYASEPALRTPEELAAMKANHRSNYHRKRRRWRHVKEVVDTVRAGAYNGLIIASFTNPVGICQRLVPLLAGGAQVVVYNMHVEFVMELCDVYSTARRTAYLLEMKRRQVDAHDAHGETDVNDDATAKGSDTSIDDSRFPVDPTLLLTPAVHHSVARPWQVLPGRTHPLMMGRGGAEGGYFMVSTRVVPLRGVIAQARGKMGRMKKREGLADEDEGEGERMAKKGRVEEEEEEEEDGEE